MHCAPIINIRQHATLFATNSLIARFPNALEGYQARQMTAVTTRVLQKGQDAHSCTLRFSLLLRPTHAAFCARRCSRDRRMTVHVFVATP